MVQPHIVCDVAVLLVVNCCPIPVVTQQALPLVCSAANDKEEVGMQPLQGLRDTILDLLHLRARTQPVSRSSCVGIYGVGPCAGVTQPVEYVLCSPVSQHSSERVDALWYW
jgi:hypothetical protein